MKARLMEYSISCKMHFAVYFQRLKASNGLWSLHFLSLMSRGALMLQPIDQLSPVKEATGVQTLPTCGQNLPGLLCTPRTSDTQL